MEYRKLKKINKAINIIGILGWSAILILNIFLFCKGDFTNALLMLLMQPICFIFGWLRADHRIEMNERDLKLRGVYELRDHEYFRAYKGTNRNSEDIINLLNDVKEFNIEKFPYYEIVINGITSENEVSEDKEYCVEMECDPKGYVQKINITEKN